MASDIGQIPVEGGDLLPFLIVYRMIVEGAAEALAALGVRTPKWASLLSEPPRRKRGSVGARQTVAIMAGKV